MNDEKAYISASALNLHFPEGEVLQAYAQATGKAWLDNLNTLLSSQEADLLYRQRNRVYRLDDPLEPGKSICIKVFKQPDPLRSAWYRHAGSKAQRAHAYARHLYAQGAAVAEPLGYLERWQGNQLVESVLLSRYLDNSTDLYSEMTYLLRERPYAEDYIKLLRFCANAIRTMHDSGFLHGDLGPQNLLMQRTATAQWAQPMFIDLNRGRLQPQPTLRARARDMERMKIPSHFRRIFFNLYFGDAPIPKEFTKWAQRYHNRFLLHQRTRKWRHPIRTVKQWFVGTGGEQRKAVSTGQPSPRNTWLWDAKSGQPSVVLQPADRKQERRGSDIWPILISGIRQAPAIWRAYKRAKQQAYQGEVDLSGRFGVCVEIDDSLEQQLRQLTKTPSITVFVRLYFHLGTEHLAQASEAIRRLTEAGHDVSIGIVQSRQAVLNLDAWQNFIGEALARLHTQVQCVEIGHAVNRVKWGLWNLEEMASLWQGVAELKARYPRLTFLGPAINDFEFQYYPALLDALDGTVDALSNHLYVDRRGAPENYQGKFSTLEKCLLGQAMAAANDKAGFYITEVNWPLTGTGEYSPLAGAYQLPNQKENSLHVSEASSAAYMVRYALIALCSGSTERLWWWRLAHPGFGLIDNRDGWRERPGWMALEFFHKTLGQGRFLKREEKQGALWWHFDRATLVYTLEPSRIQLPEATKKLTDLYGDELTIADDRVQTVNEQPVYLFNDRH